MALPPGSKELVLLVSDAGDGKSHDWATWVRPRLVLADGSEKLLTDLKWTSAENGHGKVGLNANCEGGPLLVRGEKIENGIGVHANSLLVYPLPPNTVRFRAEGALDDGGTVRNGTEKTPTSVRFLVWNNSAAPGLSGSSAAEQYVKKTTAPGHDASEAIASLDTHPDLELQLFASEPMITSPSSIDIDAKGRIWVCDVVNYRRNQGKRPEGDRILILEDTDGDGKADRTTVFHQGEDVNSAHGICVLGDRVIISAGNDIFSLYDRDGDGKADEGSKEFLFTNIGGAQHDHGIHAVHFGPDGRLYFNFGNAGKRLCDPEGNLITDIHGVRCTSENNRPYQEGMIFRCEPDGTRVELLAWNFRNNWEACVDSFGSLWQSDNDDDGNKGVRINFVMEFGNYGYKDEMTGAGWRTPRPGMSEEIPERHWHLADPGVVPNLLQTGAGSPTGICVYEGSLLPPVFRNQVIHCDAGPNVVRAYPVGKDGAGYRAEMVDLASSTRDRWFRPSDVAVAPDGSLFVADWYDPGVGGHGMGDIEKGRIFRVIPRDNEAARSYTPVPPQDAIGQLLSPNASARFDGWQKLASLGEQAAPELEEVFVHSQSPRFRARALWLLARLPNGEETIRKALSDGDPDIRITAVRAARQLHHRGALEADAFLAILREAFETSPEKGRDSVCREILISLRFLGGEPANRLWSDIARDHSPEDRWMLEAYGIGAGDFWAERTAVLFENMMPYEQYAKYLWRSRSPDTPMRITKELLKDPGKKKEAEPSPVAYLRALELQPNPTERDRAFESLFLEGDSETALFAAARLGPARIGELERGEARLQELLAPIRGTAELIQLADRLNLRGLEKELAAFIEQHPEAGESVTAARLLLRDRGRLTALLEEPGKTARATLLVRAIGKTGEGDAASLLSGMLTNEATPPPLRIEIVNAMATNGRSGRELLKLAEADRLEKSLRPVAALALARSPDSGLRKDAEAILPIPSAMGAESFPPIAELAARKGDPRKGPELHARATCATCHRINGEGIDFGPDLSEIGNKLSREGLFEAILYPSAAISHGFHGVSLTKKDGSQLVGYLTGETAEVAQIRLPGGVDQSVPLSEIEKTSELEQSLMPPGLAGVIGVDGLVDLVSWLETLKKAR